MNNISNKNTFIDLMIDMSLKSINEITHKLSLFQEISESHNTVTFKDTSIDSLQDKLKTLNMVAFFKFEKNDNKTYYSQLKKLDEKTESLEDIISKNMNEKEGKEALSGIKHECLETTQNSLYKSEKHFSLLKNHRNELDEDTFKRNLFLAIYYGKDALNSITLLNATIDKITTCKVDKIKQNALTR